LIAPRTLAEHKDFQPTKALDIQLARRLPCQPNTLAEADGHQSALQWRHLLPDVATLLGNW